MFDNPSEVPVSSNPRKLLVGHRYLGELREVCLYDARTAVERHCLMRERDALDLAEHEALELHYAETYDP